MSTHYTGEVDPQLRRHGQGKYHYPAKVFRFNGRWKDGFKDGEGNFTVEGGTTFDGSFINGEIEGYGTKIWPDGRRYQGQFSKGEADGQGTFTSPTGESYVGSWSANRRHGHGNLTLSSGQGTYTGGFKNHRFHGTGQLELASGFHYTGEFSNGQPHGHGEVTYPDGSTFRGPFEAGSRHGSGGVYVCGTSGIRYSGDWRGDHASLQPSALSIELEMTYGSPNALEGDARKDKNNSLADGKGGKAKEKAKPTKTQSTAVEEPPGTVRVENPLIATYDGDGHVEPLWCRFVRDSQCAAPDTPEILADPRIEQAGGEIEPPAALPPRELVSEESGRTLEVTLHQVTESSLTASESSWPAELSDPVDFFVSHPTATDLSQDIGRFPTENLLALFRQDKQVYPRNSIGRLAVISSSATGACPEDLRTDEQKPEGRDKDGHEQTFKTPVVQDEDALESQWRIIRGEIDSNRCLVLEAGRGRSFRTPQLVRCNEQPSVAIGATGDIPRRPYYGDGQAGNHEPTPQRGAEPDRVEQSVQRDPPCLTLCLDVHLVLDLEALGEHAGSFSPSVAWGNSSASVENSSTKNVAIVSCGDNLEVWAVLHQSADESNGAIHNECQENPEPIDSTDRCSDTIAEAEDIPAGRSSTENSIDIPCPGGWYIHAISVRLGSCVTMLPCARSTNCRRLSGVVGDTASNIAQGEQEDILFCTPGDWHSIALVADSRHDTFLLFIDGTMFRLKSTSREEPPPRSSGINSHVVTVGGQGGEWATLATSNLAVYDKAMSEEDVGTITRVFVASREQEVTLTTTTGTATEAREDEQEFEENIETRGERGQHEDGLKTISGVSSVASIKKQSVHGEVFINRIVLPKMAMEGGEWVLQLADVSHKWGAQRGEPTQAEESPEGLGAFRPLPPEFVRLKQRG